MKYQERCLLREEASAMPEMARLFEDGAERGAWEDEPRGEPLGLVGY